MSPGGTIYMGLSDPQDLERFATIVFFRDSPKNYDQFTVGPSARQKQIAEKPKIGTFLKSFSSAHKINLLTQQNLKKEPNGSTLFDQIKLDLLCSHNSLTAKQDNDNLQNQNVQNDEIGSSCHGRRYHGNVFGVCQTSHSYCWRKSSKSG